MRARGFGNAHPECMIQVAVVAILAAIAIPQFFSGHRVLNAPEIDVGNIERIAEAMAKAKLPAKQATDTWAAFDLKTAGIDTDDLELECMLADEEYKIEVRGSEWRISCPHEDNHLGFGDFRPVRTQAGWTFPPPSDDLEITTWALISRVIATPTPSGAMAIRTVSYWWRPLIGLVVGIASILLVHRYAQPGKWLADHDAPFVLAAALLCLLSVFGLMSVAFGWQVVVQPNGTIERSRSVIGIAISDNAFSRDRITAVVGGNDAFVITRTKDGDFESIPLGFSPPDAAKVAGMVSKRLVRSAPAKTEPSDSPSPTSPVVPERAETTPDKPIGDAP